MAGTVSFFSVYVTCWVLLCLFAVVLYIKDRAAYSVSCRHYWRFLFIRWKVVTFLIASTGMTVIAPYTGDPTWDYFDAFFMSALTYLTAPWSVGSLYLATKRKRNLSQALVAFCLWMFSASWSYDLYLLLKDGYYPVTWFSNIFTSSVLYISAGLFWNLDWIPGRGVTFAFLEENWPQSISAATFFKIYWVALLFMILISFLILYFFWFNVGI